MASTKNQNDAQNASSAVNITETFFGKYKKAIIIGVVAVIVIIAGVIVYNNYVAEPRAAKASTALSKGQEYFGMEEYEKALNGDSIGYAGFISIAADYSSTDAGNLANLYAGLCYAQMGKWQEAASYLEKFDQQDDQMISPAATAALGNAYAHLKQYDKAVEYLKKAASMADNQSADKANVSLSPSFLIQAGEILESQNKKDEALKIYQDIKKKYVNSPVSAEIDKYIERVSVK